MLDHLNVISRDAEVVTPEELRELLGRGGGRAYIGFEPSGLAHIGWLVCMKKMMEVLDAGLHLIIYLADWHAYINDKFSGDMETIRLCGEYLKEVFKSAGIDGRVDYIYASDIMDSISYWEKVIRISKSTTLSRMKRAMTVLGRKEEDAETDTSKLLYPALQVADIIEMNVDLALGGMDQRHAHMLQRDIARKMGWKKVVAVHTPLISSLQAVGRMDPGESKMSKSRPESTISVHESPEEIRRKLKKAYCPPSTECNPVFEIVEHIVFPYKGVLAVPRPERFGGPVEFHDLGALRSAYTSGEIHPQDLKAGTADALVSILQPIRDHFRSHPERLEMLSNRRITR